MFCIWCIIIFLIIIQVWNLLFAVLVTSTFAFVWIPGLYFKFIDKPQSKNTSSITNYKDLSNAAVYLITTLTNHGNM